MPGRLSPGHLALIVNAGAISLLRLKDFIKCFRRKSAGVWTCIASCQMALPGGRIQVAVGTKFTAGTKFMDVDIAELLEAEYQRGGHPA